MVPLIRVHLRFDVRLDPSITSRCRRRTGRMRVRADGRAGRPSPTYVHDLTPIVPSQPLPKIVGPLFTRRGLARAFGVRQRTIKRAAASARLLEIITEDGIPLYPRFQFDNRMRLVTGLAAVLQALRAGHRDPLFAAQWLTVRVYPGDLSAIERLQDGELEEVLRDARADAGSSNG